MSGRQVEVEDLEQRAQLLGHLLGGIVDPTHVEAYRVTVDVPKGEGVPLTWVTWQRQLHADPGLWMSVGRSLCPVVVLADLGILER